MQLGFFVQRYGVSERFLARGTRGFPYTSPITLQPEVHFPPFLARNSESAWIEGKCTFSHESARESGWPPAGKWGKWALFRERHFSRGAVSNGGSSWDGRLQGNGRSERFSADPVKRGLLAAKRLKAVHVQCEALILTGANQPLALQKAQLLGANRADCPCAGEISDMLGKFACVFGRGRELQRDVLGEFGSVHVRLPCGKAVDQRLV